MAIIQDILIYESGDGGELSLKNGDIETVQSITNDVYLALFGGNIEQSTDNTILPGTIREDWWGNDLMPDNYFNSEFEKTLSMVALNSAGIKTLEDAALKDVDFLKRFGTVSVSVSILDIDKMSIEVNLQEKDGTDRTIKFVFDRLKDEIIEERKI